MRKRRSAPAPVRTPRGRGRREGKRIFVLDTNVLIHDPTAIFRFDEHDIYLPMAVLEELDASKKGLSEQARNARQASRFLDQIDSATLERFPGVLLDLVLELDAALDAGAKEKRE